MDSHTNFQTSAPRRPIRPLAGYRVMARHRDRSQSLVTLAENRWQAVIRAKAFCDTIAASRDGIVSVRIEGRVGTLTEGQWRSVSPWPVPLATSRQPGVPLTVWREPAE